MCIFRRKLKIFCLVQKSISNLFRRFTWFYTLKWLCFILKPYKKKVTRPPDIQHSPVSDSSSSDFAFDKEKVDLFRRSDLVERERYVSSITDSSGSDIGYRVTIWFETDAIRDSDFAEPISEGALSTELSLRLCKGGFSKGKNKIHYVMYQLHVKMV